MNMDAPKLIDRCQNCFRSPPPFSTEDDQIGYYCVIPPDRDPFVLMSDLEEYFVVCTERVAEPCEEGELWCINCVESILLADDDDDDDDSDDDDEGYTGIDEDNLCF